jgi:predicted nucleic acid-binding protein
MSIVVSDTSPIRALAHLGLIEILRQLYGTVVIPTAVRIELGNALTSENLRTAIPEWMQIRAPSNIAEVSRLRIELDPGESEAIALAVEIHADYLLIDEWAGREVAASMGLTRVGVIGVLLQAKRHGIIPAIRPLIDRLRGEIKFRISDALYARVMHDAGE